MPALKHSLPTASVQPKTSNAGTSTNSVASGVVGAMHELIEQRLAEGAAPASSLDRGVEALSRWAAYPALLIAAVAIGYGIRALLF